MAAIRPGATVGEVAEPGYRALADGKIPPSPEGFDAEWRMIDVLTVEGDRFSRCELFDETDLDAALAWAAKCSAACMGPVEVRPFQDEPEA